MRSYFMPLFAIFLQKLNFKNSQHFIFRSNGRTNLIFDSGKIWGCKFFKKWKLEKGGAKGGQPIMFEFTQWLDQKMQIWPRKQPPELRIMVQMVGTNILKWCRPFCTPFRIQTSRAEIVNFSHFWSWDPMFMSIQRLLPPLLVYLESSRSPLQFMYLSFFLKMLCFRCTDPFPKNESVLLLCRTLFVVPFSETTFSIKYRMIKSINTIFRWFLHDLPLFLWIRAHKILYCF